MKAKDQDDPDDILGDDARVIGQKTKKQVISAANGTISGVRV